MSQLPIELQIFGLVAGMLWPLYQLYRAIAGASLTLQTDSGPTEVEVTDYH